MQLGGIGDNHSADMHQVTNCLHDHGKLDKGGAGIQTTPGMAAQQVIQKNQGQEAQLSLFDWIQKLFGNGKQRMLGFWNGSEYASSGDRSEKTGSSQTMAQVSSASAADAAGVSQTAKEMSVYNSPYFAAVPVEQHTNTAVTLPQKIKLKCSNIAGQLAKHLPGRFAGFQKEGSFHARKEGNKEDLRRRSRYREDKLEVDCILTDESYLLDSYDRKGEYSKLTTTK